MISSVQNFTSDLRARSDDFYYLFMTYKLWSSVRLLDVHHCCSLPSRARLFATPWTSVSCLLCNITDLCPSRFRDSVHWVQSRESIHHLHCIFTSTVWLCGKYKDQYEAQSQSSS